MTFLLILLLTCLWVAIASRSIRSMPWLWYGIAIAIDVLYAYGVIWTLPTPMLQLLSAIVQRGMVATSLFIIVMYCGVFSEDSGIRRTLSPIRAELSIIACILALAHCLNYLNSYLGVLTNNFAVINDNQLASLLIAVVLFVLLIVLGVTSVRAVKRAMKASTWKYVQKSAYVFFALIYFHELLILYPSAAKGSGDALTTLTVSGIIFGFYFVLRFVRYRQDKKAGQSTYEIIELQGEEI